MELSFTAYGDARGDGPPLVIAHGLFGSGRNWTGFARALAADRRVLTVDLRNHGESPWDKAMGYAEMGGDLLALIEAEAGGEAVLLGHSMGGKAAMAAALTEPDAVFALIVADIAPVAYDHSHIGYVDAMLGLDLGAISRRGEADAALADTIPEQGVRQFLLQNLEFGGERPRWKLNLEAIPANMDALTGFPFAADEARYEGPALFVAGSESDYIEPGHHDAIRAFFPDARIESIAGAGHWVHAEKPQAFGALVIDFLKSL